MPQSQIPPWAVPVNPTQEQPQIPSWAKPVKKTEDEESTLGKIWNAINEPLYKITPEMRKAMASYTQEHPYLGRVGELGAGLAEYASSPLGAGLGITAGASRLAKLAGLSKAATALELPSQLASGGMVVHGGVNALKAETGPERFGALLEMGLGGLGLRSPHETPGTGLIDPRRINPRGQLGLQNPQGPFTGGEAGLAGPNPYPIDTGAINPRISGQMGENVFHPGSADQGHVLTNELGEVVWIPPDLAARRGIGGLGRPQSYQPTPEVTPNRGFALPPAPEQPKALGAGPGFIAPEQGPAQAISNRGFEPVPERQKPFNPDELFPPAKLEEPQFMKVPGTGTKEYPNIAVGGAEPPVLKVLASSLYSGDRPKITTKELLQNSFDEHRIIGQTEPIRVLMNNDIDSPTGSGEKTNAITVRDFGRGLNPEELYRKFTDVGQTGKKGVESASGGFGFAKAAPLLSGDYVQVTSIVQEGKNKVKYSFEGPPNELGRYEGTSQKGVPFKREVLDREDETPTGLKVTTYFPDKMDLYEARNVAEAMAKQSPSITSDVKVANTYSYDMNDKSVMNFLDSKKLKPDTYLVSSAKTHTKLPEKPLQGTIETPGATVNIHFNDPTINDEYTGYKAHILNKGLYQTSTRGSYSYRPVSRVPPDITFDVISKVEEGEPNYPFTANREQLDSRLSQEIDSWVKKNLVEGSLERQKARLQQLYDTMPDFPNVQGKRRIVMFDPGNRLTAPELERYRNSPILTSLASHLDSVVDDIIKSTGKELNWGSRLEGVGLVFDDNMYGVHIPNPSTDKSTILINPLLHMVKDATPEDAALNTMITALHETAHIGRESGAEVKIPSTIPLDDPRIGKYLYSYLKHVKEQGGINVGHGFEFIHRLGEIYAKYGPEKTFEGSDLIEQAITDESGRYNPEVQELLRIYNERGRRPETTPDLLSGTGDKQEFTKPGKGNVTGSNQPNGEGADPKKPAPIDSPQAQQIRSDARNAMDKLARALQVGKESRVQQDVINRYEHAKRAGMMSDVKTEGLAGFYQRVGKLKGEFPKVRTEQLLLDQKDTDSLFTAINNSVTLREYDKINAGSGLLKLLSGVAPQAHEIKLLNNVFGDEFGQIIEMHGGFGANIFSDTAKTRQLLNEIVNLPKSYMASFDLSAPLRQGLPLIGKRAYWEAFQSMFKYAGSQKAFDGLMQAIENRPLAELGKDSGLKLTDIGEQLGKREEAFISHWAESGEFLREGPLRKGYQKTIGAVVKGSDRAYVGFLNKLRADVFDQMIYKAKDAGVLNEALAKEIAYFVNAASGRGELNIGKIVTGGKYPLGNFEKIATDLNAVFFSPRMIASRLTLLNPAYYIVASPIVRQEALKALFSVAGAGLLVANMAKLAGADVSDNPTSTDFGKIRFGKTRIDPWAGFQQYVVAATRFITNKTTSSQTGITREFGKGFNAPNRMDVLYSSSPYRRGMIENKLSPVASFVDNIIKGTESSGEPFKMTNEIRERFEPLLLQDLTQVWKNDPTMFPWAALAGTFGMGVQSYQDRPPLPNKKPNFRMTLPLRLPSQ